MASLSSALHPEVVSNHMSIVQPMGLAFFVYCVGISAGATFFQNLRKQTNLLALTTIVCVVGALIALVGGRLLGLSSGLTSGLFTGALTAAPALDTATRLTGDPTAAVGYAFGYPVGVIGGILIVTITVTEEVGRPQGHAFPRGVLPGGREYSRVQAHQHARHRRVARPARAPVLPAS